MGRKTLVVCSSLLLLAGTALSPSCGTVRQATGGRDVVSQAVVSQADVTLAEGLLEDRVWTFSQTHPEGFTLDIRTMTEPARGVSVAYAETQDSHSRENLPQVLAHALAHDGYVGGWKEDATGLYYFDSVRLFPEDSLAAAIAFGRQNHQLAIYVISTGEEISLEAPESVPLETPTTITLETPAAVAPVAP